MRNMLLISIAVLITACGGVRTPVRLQTGQHASTTISDNYSLRKKKIAILPFHDTGYNRLDPVLSDRFAVELMRLGFMVVDRAQLESIFSELKLNMSGALSSNDVKRIGKLLSVDMIVSGTIFPLDGNRPGETLRMIDVETGEVVISSYCCELGFAGSSVAVEISNSIKNSLASFADKNSPKDR